MKRKAGRCHSCSRQNHLDCDRRQNDDARCTCRCVSAEGQMEHWALIETGTHYPSRLATHAMVASSLRICWSRSDRTPRTLYRVTNLMR